MNQSSRLNDVSETVDTELKKIKITTLNTNTCWNEQWYILLPFLFVSKGTFSVYKFMTVWLWKSRTLEYDFEMFIAGFHSILVYSNKKAPGGHVGLHSKRN